MRTSRRRVWAPARLVPSGAGLATAALIAGLGCVLFAPALFGGRVLSPSAWVQFTPPFAANRPSTLTSPPNLALHDNTVLYEDHRFAARTSVEAGHAPLWDPSVGAGRPLGAEQGAPFFLTTWLAYLLPFWHSLAWMALVKLLLAGVGMALFCRALGLGRAPAMLAAVSFAFSNLFIAFLGHGHTGAYALAPWALLSAERLAATAAPQWAAGLGLAVGLAAYNGHPESFFLMAVLSGLYLVFRLLASRTRRDGGIARRVLLFAGAVVLALALGAFALVTLVSILRQGPALNPSAAEHASLPDLAVGAFMPEFWGRPDKVVFNQTLTPVFTALYYGRPYLGVIPVLLAGIGLLRRPTPQQWFFLAVAAVGTLLTLGGPVRAVERHLPLFSQVRPFEYLWPVMVAVAVLAAFGAQRLLDGDRALVKRAAPLIGIIAVAIVGASLHLRPHLVSALGAALGDVATLRPSEHSADAAAAGALLRALLLCAVVGAALAAARRPPLARVTVVVLIAFTALDLGLLAHGWWPMPPQRQVAPAPTRSLQTIRASGPAWRMAALQGDFAPDLAERYGVLDARVNDEPQLSRYSDLFTQLGGFLVPGLGESVLTHLGSGQLKLLDLYSVRWLLDGGSGAPPGGLRVLSARTGDRLLENPAALPRAYVAYGSRSAAGPQAALRVIRESSLSSLYRAPVIEGAPTASSAATPTSATFTSSGTTRVRLSFTAPRAGWLILGDTFFPGWHATVDGRSAPIHPADEAFRAIPVPAGHHVAEFSYAPGAEIAAGWLSALTLFGTVLALAAGFALRRGPGRLRRA